MTHYLALTVKGCHVTTSSLTGQKYRSPSLGPERKKYLTLLVSGRKNTWCLCYDQWKEKCLKVGSRKYAPALVGGKIALVSVIRSSSQLWHGISGQWLLKKCPRVIAGVCGRKKRSISCVGGQQILYGWAAPAFFAWSSLPLNPWGPSQPLLCPGRILTMSIAMVVVPPWGPMYSLLRYFLSAGFELGHGFGYIVFRNIFVLFLHFSFYPFRFHDFLFYFCPLRKTFWTRLCCMYSTMYLPGIRLQLFCMYSFSLYILQPMCILTLAIIMFISGSCLHKYTCLINFYHERRADLHTELLHFL